MTESLEDILERKRDDILNRMEKNKIKDTPKDEWDDPKYLKKVLSKINSLVDMPAKTYNIKFNINIENEGLLVLKPGTKLLFEGYSGIKCNGKLIAKGTKNNPIYFSSEKQWDGIEINDEKAENSVIDHCVIENSINSGVSISGTKNIKIMNSVMRNNQNSGISVYTSHNIEIIKNIITKNIAEYGGGINFRSYNSRIIDNKIAYNTARRFGGGIDIDSDSDTEVRRNQFIGNTAEQGGAAYVSHYIRWKNNTIKNNKSLDGGKEISSMYLLK